jgi:hypothetical protein
MRYFTLLFYLGSRGKGGVADNQAGDNVSGAVVAGRGGHTRQLKRKAVIPAGIQKPWMARSTSTSMCSGSRTTLAALSLPR